MKKVFLISLLSVFIFAGCQKDKISGSELAGFSVLSVGVDGNTDLLLNNLKSAIIVEYAELSDDETTGLLWMREEEKLAHDLYISFNEAYQQRVFENISNSESNHMDAVIMLLDTFKIEDPAQEGAGVFTNQDLQQAYDDLVAAGAVSLVEALKVGAYVEELDILDLEEQIELTQNEDILFVYQNLLRASRNHLRAFNRVLGQNGVTYEPALLTETYFAEIINSDMERGGFGGTYGYGKANRQGGNNRAGYNSANGTCTGVPVNAGTGQQKRYGRGGN